MASRKERIQELRIKAECLRKQSDELYTEIHKLEMEQAKEDHPCSCVKLNGDIEIYDMVEQERRGRRGLQFGTVADTLSARKDCEFCKGTGKPSKHTHFGEVFMPDTCPACRLIQRGID